MHSNNQTEKVTMNIQRVITIFCNFIMLKLELVKKVKEK